MPKRINIQTVGVEYDESDPDGFKAGGARLGRLLGATLTGASVYELPPGQSICPYHYEYGEEEWLIVLTGVCSVRDPEGTHDLRAGDVVCFSTGPAGAHKVTNTSEQTIRVLMLSTVKWPAVTVYPDSDKIGAYMEPGVKLVVRRSDAREYYDGEN
jgi:uncharacterized cupin superfamily protein